jgi:KDO2-lipid IV(A) lauroyltransferase
MYKKLRRFATFLLIKSLIAIAVVLPRRMGHAFFGVLGAVAYRFLGQSRRVALANLKLVYGRKQTGKQLEDIARRSFVNLGKFAFDIVNLGNCAQARLDRLVEVVGMHHLDGMLARGTGVVALSAHIGNWELLAAYLARAGYPLTVMATRIKDPRLDDLLVGIRSKAGLRVLERSKGLVGAFRCLKRGEMLGVLIDQDTSVDSVTVDFLGHPARTPVGPAKLAARTGAAIVPMAMLMTPEGTYRIEIREPINLNGDTPLDHDVERCSKVLEEFIRHDPDQWVWMHKRWKSVFSDMYA